MTDNWYEKARLEDIVFAKYIGIPYPQNMEHLVGYNPQKLLPSPETARPLTTREWTSLYVRLFDFADGWLDDSIDLMVPRGRTFRHIDFASLYEPIPVDFGTGTGRRLAPFVTPIHHTTPRWGRFADTDPIDDIRDFVQNREVKVTPKPQPLDFSEIELRMAAASIGTAIHSQIDRQLMLYGIGLTFSDRRYAIYDLDSPGGEIPGVFDMPKSAVKNTESQVVSTSSGKRDMSYLKHDRTKKHRRRRK